MGIGLDLQANACGIEISSEVVTNERGAKQSKTAYRADLLPAKAVLSVAGVLREGAQKYAPNNWRGIPLEDHLNHALIHIFAFLHGDTQEPHLSHAACRMLMALETFENPPKETGFVTMHECDGVPAGTKVKMNAEGKFQPS